MSKKRWMLLGAALVLAVVSAAVTIMLLRSNESTQQESGPSPTVASAPKEEPHSTISESNIELLETGLNSSDRSEQEKALAPELRSGEWSPEGLLPDGAVLTVNRDTFKADGDMASVSAVVTGSIQAEFLLRLTLVDGVWLIFETQQTH